jgi:hypothetical protein
MGNAGVADIGIHARLDWADCLEDRDMTTEAGGIVPQELRRRIIKRLDSYGGGVPATDLVTEAVLAGDAAPGTGEAGG